KGYLAVVDPFKQHDLLELLLFHLRIAGIEGLREVVVIAGHVELDGTGCGVGELVDLATPLVSANGFFGEFDRKSTGLGALVFRVALGLSIDAILGTPLIGGRLGLVLCRGCFNRNEQTAEGEGRKSATNCPAAI